MVINESGLVKAMKASYKDGYHVAAGTIGNSEYMMIVSYGYTWAVAVQRDNVPRKVLGLIAEHLRKIPENGEAYKLQRDEDPQEELYHVATEPLYRMIDEVSAPEGLPRVFKTKLVYGNRNVWQQLDNLDIMLLNPRYENISAGMNMEARRVDNCLCTQGEMSYAFICKTAPGKEEEKMIERMGKTMWL